MSKIYLNMNLAGFSTAVAVMALLAVVKNPHLALVHHGDILCMFTLWLYFFGIVLALIAIQGGSAVPEGLSLGFWVAGSLFLVQAVGDAVLPSSTDRFWLIAVPLTIYSAYLWWTHRKRVRERTSQP